jgi:regulator-associated protein of mTOR
VLSSRQSGGGSAPLDAGPANRDCIVLSPCGANELLPMDPQFPADLFTACLTTPILIALRWFITQNRSAREHSTALYGEA